MCDEPVLGPDMDTPWAALVAEPAVVDCIETLVKQEPFAVLCTQGDGQPYGSVVAFAFGEDLCAFCFATTKATRKFRLLSECQRVALVVDSRASFPDDLMRVEAVTVTGRAHELEPGPEFKRWAGLLTGRHPYFRSFIEAPSTAVFRVEVVRFLYVTRFQEVRQWLPPSAG